MANPHAGRNQSDADPQPHQPAYLRVVRTRVASTCSPWLQGLECGEVYSIPVSHGEGRLVADEAMIEQLFANGQVAFQYCDETGTPTMDPTANLNGSDWAIEGLVSPDGNGFGKNGSFRALLHGCL